MIRRLGLLNERVQEDHAAYGVPPNPRYQGVPYPGAFALDETGVITVKRFHESYRERDTGRGILARALGIVDPGPDASAGTGPVRVRVWLDSPTYSMFQRLHVNIELTIDPGFHVYGHPAEAGYVPLSVEVAPIGGVTTGPPRWPPASPFVIEGLAERFWVHEGTVRGSLPLTFTAPPGAGDQIVRGSVAYQACSASACLPPSSVGFELPVKEVALVDRSLPGRPAPE